jgi:LEA14-like dessication related protein
VLRAPAVFLLAGILFLTSCSVARLVDREALKKPSVRVESASLQALSFTGADLLVVLQVRNPNPVGVMVTGLDYELQVDGVRLAGGSRDEDTRIHASGSSSVSLPLRVEYPDLLASSSRLLDRERSSYLVSCGVSCRVPVLGEVRVPVTVEGTLPVLRLPSVSFSGLRIEELSVSGARLLLRLELENPGGYPLVVSELVFGLEVDGEPWARGSTEEAVEIGKNTAGILELPLDLDLARMGEGARSLLSGQGEIAYLLEGAVRFQAGLPLAGESTLLGETERRFSLSGTVSPGR